MIRMNKNESPYRALTEDEIAQIAIDTHFNEYMEDEYEDLCRLYADFFDLDPTCIAFANGSDEWIQRAMIVLPEGPMMTFEPDFVMYDVYAEQFNRPIEKIAVNDDFTYDYEAAIQRIKEVKPAIFIFSQPNNPLGLIHPEEFIVEVSNLMKEWGGYFILDLAYVEFTDDLPAYPTGDHIIRFRTLSKVFGLAGLRVGLATSTRKTMDVLESISHPYPLNTFSLNVPRVLLQQPERLQAFIEKNRELANLMKQVFKEEVGEIIPMIDSHTNFLFTYGEDAVDLGNWITQHGYILRTYPDSAAPSLKKAVRYSIAKEEELEQLRYIIREWREKKWSSQKNA
uniref:aminotransferase class I/II-fold pyridoxal phosphate-dependent enzyme n=1 Tax=Aerococcus urinaeequi TaxID=51665 RepID=UPI00352B9703